jgi:hypothetical protein
MQPYKDPRAPMRLKGWMEAAGFVDVEQQQLMLPMCAWPRCESDPFQIWLLWSATEANRDAAERQRNVGAANRGNVQRLLSSLAVYPFTQFLRWVSRPGDYRGADREHLSMSLDDVHLLVAQARREADDPAFKVNSPHRNPGRGR